MPRVAPLYLFTAQAVTSVTGTDKQNNWINRAMTFMYEMYMICLRAYFTDLHIAPSLCVMSEHEVQYIQYWLRQPSWYRAFRNALHDYKHL
jgi:hypothetical protein